MAQTLEATSDETGRLQSLAARIIKAFGSGLLRPLLPNIELLIHLHHEASEDDPDNIDRQTLARVMQIRGRIRVKLGMSKPEAEPEDNTEEGYSSLVERITCEVDEENLAAYQFFIALNNQYRAARDFVGFQRITNAVNAWLSRTDIRNISPKTLLQIRGIRAECIQKMGR